jgi:hypothetical protein
MRSIESAERQFMAIVQASTHPIFREFQIMSGRTKDIQFMFLDELPHLIKEEIHRLRNARVVRIDPTNEKTSATEPT